MQTLTLTIPSPRAAVTSVVAVTNAGTAAMTVGPDTLPINIGGQSSITGTTCPVAPATLAAGGGCTIRVRYATPGVRPLLPDVGRLSVVNSGVRKESIATARQTLEQPPYRPDIAV